jgi:hypothetical protein
MTGRHHRAGAKRRDPVIHLAKEMDCRVKPGNDVLSSFARSLDSLRFTTTHIRTQGRYAT